ncbi:MAG: hypothetical protein HY650_08575 [Acidobacteria bacterium]|nr:hypothetical protein [Acidobacteriota bacterium]
MEPSNNLVPAAGPLSSVTGPTFPEILACAGQAADFAAGKFFLGKIRNALTRAAYLRAVKLYLLSQAFHDYIQHHNQDPEPFIWTAKGEDIIEKYCRVKAMLDNAQTA